MLHQVAVDVSRATMTAIIHVIFLGCVFVMTLPTSPPHNFSLGQFNLGLAKFSDWLFVMDVDHF